MYRHVSHSFATLLFLVFGFTGCSDKAAKVADFQGEWESTEGGLPTLYLDADGNGVLCVMPSGPDEGSYPGSEGGRYIVKSVTSRVTLRQEGRRFFVSVNVKQFNARFQLLSMDHNMLKLRLVDSKKSEEFTLKRAKKKD